MARTEAGIWPSTQTWYTGCMCQAGGSYIGVGEGPPPYLKIIMKAAARGAETGVRQPAFVPYPGLFVSCPDVEFFFSCMQIDIY